MTPTPPPLPAARKIPTWVWVLTICGVIFVVSVYVAVFWGYSTVLTIARQELQKSNPDFEILSYSTEGKVKIRHRATRKEFLIKPPLNRGRILLRPLATKAVSPIPNWLQLKDAGPNPRGGWDRMGDTGMLREALDDLFLDREFVIEAQDDKTLTACNAALLHCAVIAYGFAENADNRAWYSASFFEAP